jgi:hypothetical protein
MATLDQDLIRFEHRRRVALSLLSFFEAEGERAVRISRVPIGRHGALTIEATLITERTSYAGRGGDPVDALSEVLQEWELRS